jgi:DNA-binding GntR family transcriptional regulator
MAFHQHLWEIADNEHLSRMLEQVAFKFFAFLKMRPAVETEYSEAVEHRRRIYEGLRSGDPAIALEAFTSSTLKFWKEQLGIEVQVFKYFRVYCA